MKKQYITYLFTRVLMTTLSSFASVCALLCRFNCLLVAKDIEHISQENGLYVECNVAVCSIRASFLANFLLHNAQDNLFGFLVFNPWVVFTKSIDASKKFATSKSLTS